ncbi:hypothetical protein SEA_MORGANA_86 [Gordonia phage Morgana]|uniref:Uncharacterized protein n=1 Tax=Gordonia phage Morgana TaxID=3137292 RepID=A0AAX4RAT0_9CAUD
MAGWRIGNNGVGRMRWFVLNDALPIEQRFRYSKTGRHIRYASPEAAQREADRLNTENVSGQD